MKGSKWLVARVAIIAAVLWSSVLEVAIAEPPPLLPIQGYLTNSASQPLDGTHQIRFRLYDADTAGTTLFEETLDVNVADGFFTIYLGDTVALDQALFRDNAGVYLGIKVGTDAEAEPRLQLATTAFASLAAFCGDADTVGGLPADSFQARVVGSCGAGQFMQTIDDDGNVSCGAPAAEADPQVGALSDDGWCTSDGTTVVCNTAAPVLAETDPQVGTLTNARWCTSDGSAVICNTNAPITAEADPQVGTLAANGWCTSDGSSVSCNAAPPVTAEADPQVGMLTNARWCTSDGTSVSCTTLPPVTAEVDPQVGTLVSSNWCTSDGSSVNCNSAAPVLAEADPQVGSLAASAVPRWDGSALNAGRIFDNGMLVGINNTSPSEELDVGGDVEVTGTYRFSSARTFHTFYGPAAFNPSTAADLDDWSKSSSGYGFMVDGDGASTGAVLMLADLNLPEGATLSTVACSYQDENATAGIGYTLPIPSGGSLPVAANFYLYRRNVAGEAVDQVFNDDVSTTAMGTNATPTSVGWADATPVAGMEVVDNANYDYYLYVSWAVSDDTVSSLKFYGCRVTYTLLGVSVP